MFDRFDRFGSDKQTHLCNPTMTSVLRARLFAYIQYRAMRERSIRQCRMFVGGSRIGSKWVRKTLTNPLTKFERRGHIFPRALNFTIRRIGEKARRLLLRDISARRSRASIIEEERRRSERCQWIARIVFIKHLFPARLRRDRGGWEATDTDEYVFARRKLEIAVNAAEDRP